MRRRLWVHTIAAATLFGAWHGSRAQAPAPATGALRRLTVLEFELVDEQHNPLTKAATEQRLRNATVQLRQELGERRLYTVVDPAPSQALQD